MTKQSGAPHTPAEPVWCDWRDYSAMMFGHRDSMAVHRDRREVHDQAHALALYASPQPAPAPEPPAEHLADLLRRADAWLAWLDNGACEHSPTLDDEATLIRDLAAALRAAPADEKPDVGQGGRT